MDHKIAAEKVLDVFTQVTADLRDGPQTEITITHEKFQNLRFRYEDREVPSFSQAVNAEDPDLWLGAYIAATFLTLINVHPDHTHELLFQVMTGNSASSRLFTELGQTVRVQRWLDDDARDVIRDSLLIETALYELKTLPRPKMH